MWSVGEMIRWLEEAWAPLVGNTFVTKMVRFPVGASAEVIWFLG